MPAAQRQSCFLAIRALPWRAVGTSSRADDRGNRVQVTLALDYRLMERVDAAARHRATSRVALIAAWLAEKLGQEPHETDRHR